MGKNKNRDRTQQQPRSAGARGSEQSKNAAVESEAETMQSPAGSADAARKNRKSGHN